MSLLMASPAHGQTREEYNQVVARAEASISAAQIALRDAQEAYNQAVASLSVIDGNITIAQNVVSEKTDALNTAQLDLIQAQINFANAKTAYETSYIPDPDWIRPTKEIQVAEEVPYTVLVPHTEIVQETVLVPRIVTRIIPGGLTAKVYNMAGYNNAPPYPTESRLVSTQTVPNINYQWGGGYILNTWLSEDTIVNFSGKIYIPATGTYYFYAPGDDGVRLLIDGVLIINDWYDKGGGGSQVAVTLTQGMHDIALWYYENGGGANVWLYWATPWYGWQIVPASAFGEQIIEEIVYDEVITYREVTTYVEETRYQTIYHTEIVPDDEAQAPLINDPSLLDEIDVAQDVVNEKELAQTTANNNLTQAQEQLTGLNIDRQKKVVEIDLAAKAVVEKQNNLKVAQNSLASIQPYVEPVVEPEPQPEPVPEPPVEEPQSDEEIMAELLAEAQADDIVISEELAAIPVVGAVAETLVEALNFFGNAGADMTPEVREKAEEVVVAAVVAGQVAQVASAASASAASAATRRVK